MIKQAINSLLSGLNINILIVALVIYSAVITLLWQHNKNALYTLKIETKAIAKQKELENLQEIKAREQVTSDVVTSYAESINKLKAYYANNPHVKYRTISLHDNTSCSGVSTTSQSTTRASQATNGNAETITERDSREVQINAEILSKEIVQCLELIKFNVGQDEVK
jgi:hypothetical protein